MKMIDNGHIKNWTPVIGQTCQACNRLRPREYGIEVTPVCLGAGRNFDNRGVDISDLSNGVYIVQLMNEGVLVKSTKFLKIK
jgi:hypothetical protein